MIRSLPTGRAGQLVAAGLSLLMLAAIGLGVIRPVLDWYQEGAEMLTGRAALARRMEVVVAQLPELREQAAALSASTGDTPALLAGDSDPVASAALQESLQAMFRETGVPLSSVETLSGEEAGPYRRIRLRLSFTASYPALATLLRSIGESSPVLMMDELQVRPALHRIGITPGTFDVECTVFAFRPGMSKVSVR